MTDNEKCPKCGKIIRSYGEIGGGCCNEIVGGSLNSPGTIRISGGYDSPRDRILKGLDEIRRLLDKLAPPPVT